MSIVVYSYNELKDAIEKSLDDYIILGSDITADYNVGIMIPLSTQNLTIDGKDPITGINHVYNDHIGQYESKGIYVSNILDNMKITIKNMNVYIRRTFGMINVVATIFPPGVRYFVDIIFENIIFNGVSLVNNHVSRTTIRNCTITSDKLDSPVDKATLFETMYLIIEGNVNITHSSPNSGVFSNRALETPSYSIFINIKEDSNLVVKCLDSAFFGAFAEYVVCNIERGSNVYIESYHGLTRALPYAGAKDIIIHEDATFYIKKTGVVNNYTLGVNNTIEVKENATFIAVNENNENQPLIGHQKNAPNIIFNNPKRIVLYNSYAPIFNLIENSKITINSQQLNYWDVAKSLDIAGNIDDMPKYAYKKIDQSNMDANITFEISNNYNIVSNIIEGDEGFPLNPTTFNLSDSKVISLGRLTAEIDKIEELDTNITGITDPNTEIRTTISESIYNDLSNNDGTFDILLDEELKIGSYINILFNNEFLHTIYDYMLQGTLTMEVPDLVVFKNRSVPLNVGIIKRQSDFKIIIKDTRKNANNFLIYAYVISPLSSEFSLIDDSVIFKEETSKILNVNKTLIYEGEANTTDITITTLEYEELEGLLLELDPNILYPPGEYKTRVYWTLEEKET